MKLMRLGVMKFYTKEICTRRLLNWLVFSLRQNIRD